MSVFRPISGNTVNAKFEQSSVLENFTTWKKLVGHVKLMGGIDAMEFLNRIYKEICKVSEHLVEMVAARLEYNTPHPRL